MPIGKRQAGGHEPRARKREARGFTYLGVLLLLALLGALLAGVGHRAQLTAQRERERELLFRGQQIAQAISAYRTATDPPAWPQRLDELLADRRQGPPVHHLRRLWADPFTRQADWVLLPAPPPATGFIGVHSRVAQRRLLQADGPTSPAGTNGPLLSDWHFVAPAGEAPAEPKPP